jgi:hypothetical protein
MAELGRLEPVDLREVWRHEERDFSAWLAREENMELLADELGLEIAILQREAPVGGFQVDILAEEANTGRRVIIENQLETTNHDHLGKLITYAAGLDAAIVVWIVRDARDEHRRAIEWLNEHTDESLGFFLVRMEVWRIADSPPAPRFHVLVQPNDWARAVRQADRLSGAKLLQLEYWTAFNEAGRGRTKLSLRRAQARHWHTIGIGSSEAEMRLTVNGPREEIAVELYIADNKALFDCLQATREAIEAELGSRLSWQPLPGRKASRVKLVRKADYANKEDWAGQHRWLLETAEAFARVFGPRVRACAESAGGA